MSILDIIFYIVLPIIAMAIILVIAFNRVKLKGKKIEEESIIELFIKDQITITEVNYARVHNFKVSLKKEVSK